MDALFLHCFQVHLDPSNSVKLLAHICCCMNRRLALCSLGFRRRPRPTRPTACRWPRCGSTWLQRHVLFAFFCCWGRFLPSLLADACAAAVGRADQADPGDHHAHPVPVRVLSAVFPGFWAGKRASLVAAVNQVVGSAALLCGRPLRLYVGDRRRLRHRQRQPRR